MKLLGQVGRKNPEDDDGNTPLHYAAEKGHFEMVQYLFDGKLTKNHQGKSPLDLAKNDQIIAFLRPQ